MVLQPVAQGSSEQQYPGKGAVNHKMHHLQREKFCWMPVIHVDLREVSAAWKSVSWFFYSLG